MGVLYCFLRLQIYEAIAVIFWQSATYVLRYSLIHNFQQLNSSGGSSQLNVK